MGKHLVYENNCCLTNNDPNLKCYRHYLVLYNGFTFSNVYYSVSSVI